MTHRWSQDQWLDYLSDWKTQLDGNPDSEMYDFDFDNRSNLLVSAGCSWTHGASLDPGSRSSQTFGSLISRKFDFDWINLGLSGWSNAHILLTTQKIIDRLICDNSYQKIVVIITLTENAREIRTSASYPFDYNVFYKNNPGKEFFPNLLKQFENSFIEQMTRLIDSTDHRFQFIVGQSTVRYDKLLSIEKDRLSIVKSRWIDILAEKQALFYPPTESQIAYGWNVESLDLALQFVGEDETSLQDAKICLLDMINKYEKLQSWFELSDLNDPKTKHPTTQGHQFWADYLNQFIQP